MSLLGLLDVRLVERVDRRGRRPRSPSRPPSGTNSRAEVDRVGDVDPDDRVAGRRGCVGERVARRRRARVGAREREPDEDAVVAVGRDRRRAARGRPGRSRRRACRCSRRSAARPTRRSWRCRRVGDERQLVAAVLRERPDREAEATRRGSSPGPARGSASSIAERRREQRVEVEPDQAGRHEPDVRQRGVAAADVGRVEEDLAERRRGGGSPRCSCPGSVIATIISPACSNRGAWRARSAVSIRSQQSARKASGSVVVPDLLATMKSVASGSRSSTTAATAAGSVESRTRSVEPVLDRRRTSSCEDVRGEAAAAHPGDDRGREAGVADPLAEALEGADLVGEMGRGVEPAEALGDRLPGRGRSTTRASCPSRTGAPPSPRRGPCVTASS